MGTDTPINLEGANFDDNTTGHQARSATVVWTDVDGSVGQQDMSAAQIVETHNGTLPVPPAMPPVSHNVISAQITVHCEWSGGTAGPSKQVQAPQGEALTSISFSLSGESGTYDWSTSHTSQPIT